MSAANTFLVDTNIFLYSISTAELEKQQIAEQWLAALWSARVGRVSWQVINEFYSQATRKLRISPESARFTAEHLCAWDPEPQTAEITARAWHWCDSAQINYWDALIIAAAEQCGCRYLLTEDLQSGRKFADLEVVNPFQRQPEEFQLAYSCH